MSQERSWQPETDMASTSNLRSRRSRAQLHALAEVEREIRAQDSHGRRKYLLEFNQSFRTYESVLTIEDVHGGLLTRWRGILSASRSGTAS